MKLGAQKSNPWLVVITSAFCLHALSARAQTTPAPAAPPAEEILAEPAVVEEARGHFRQGIAFAESGNCGAAIAEFEAAYKLVMRASALYNIAQCDERLFRYDLAIANYERYLKEAAPDAPDRSAVNAALSTLRNLLGTVHVYSNVKAEVWMDDRLVGEAPGDVYIPAGGHSLELRAKGFIPKRTEVKLVGREKVTVEVELERAQTTVQVTETTGLSPAVFWVGAAATVITAGIGIGFAFEVGSLHDHAETLAPVDPERKQARADIEDAELTADIFFGSALVLGIGTTLIGFLTEWEERESVVPTSTAGSIAIAPAIGDRSVALQMRGAF